MTTVSPKAGQAGQRDGEGGANWIRDAERYDTMASGLTGYLDAQVHPFPAGAFSGAGA